MNRQKHRKAKPTPADKAAAVRLRAIWMAIPAKERPTQDQLAERWAANWGNDDEGMTQSAISQYLNGKLPLKPMTVMRFAELLKCKPTDIRSDQPELQMGNDKNSALRAGNDYFARKLAEVWTELTDETKGQILGFALVNAVTRAAPKKA